MKCRRSDILHHFQINTHEINDYGLPVAVVTAGCICGWDYYLVNIPKKCYWSYYKTLNSSIDAKIELAMKEEYHKSHVMS